MTAEGVHVNPLLCLRDHRGNVQGDTWRGWRARPIDLALHGAVGELACTYRSVDGQADTALDCSRSAGSPDRPRQLVAERLGRVPPPWPRALATIVSSSRGPSL